MTFPAGFTHAATEALLAEHRVPGVSLSIVEGHGISGFACGTREFAADQPVNDETVFEAASLSKPVTSYIALQLARAGAVSLDEPLARYLPQYLPGHSNSAITARHVLSHTTGLPNWRSDSQPLKAHFKPGERFSYSGEGFLYLQRAIEHVSGISFDKVADRLVFFPLGMKQSSFIWQDRFSDNHAMPHDSKGNAHTARYRNQSNAAGSLYTTAHDYARFLQSVLLEADLGVWLRPHAHVMKNHLTWLDDGPPPETDPQIAWGLGWGVEVETGHFFHWGDQNGFKAFAIGSAATGRAAVILTNGDAGLSIMSKFVNPFIPGYRPSLAWLGYEADLL